MTDLKTLLEMVKKKISYDCSKNELNKFWAEHIQERDAEIKRWKDMYASCPACGESFVSLASTAVECHEVKIENTHLKAKLEKAEAALEKVKMALENNSRSNVYPIVDEVLREIRK